jgi:hypothetical protein
MPPTSPGYAVLNAAVPAPEAADPEGVRARAGTVRSVEPACCWSAHPGYGRPTSCRSTRAAQAPVLRAGSVWADGGALSDVATLWAGTIFALQVLIEHGQVPPAPDRLRPAAWHCAGAPESCINSSRRLLIRRSNTVASLLCGGGWSPAGRGLVGELVAVARGAWGRGLTSGSDAAGHCRGGGGQ